MSVYHCEICQTLHDADVVGANEHAGGLACDDGVDAEFEEQRAYWEPLYRGEKLAGLTRCP